MIHQWDCTRLHPILTLFAAVHRQPQPSDGCYPACYRDGLAFEKLIAAYVDLGCAVAA